MGYGDAKQRQNFIPNELVGYATVAFDNLHGDVFNATHQDLYLFGVGPLI